MCDSFAYKLERTARCGGERVGGDRAVRRDQSGPFAKNIPINRGDKSHVLLRIPLVLTHLLPGTLLLTAGVFPSGYRCWGL